MNMKDTFKVVDLIWTNNIGLEAATPDLAKLAPGPDLGRFKDSRFAVEQTDWVEEREKLTPVRSVIVEVEDPADPWQIVKMNVTRSNRIRSDPLCTAACRHGR